MAVTRLGLLGSAQDKVSGTTLAITNSSGATIPAGTLLAIAFTFDNHASVTATVTSLSNGAGGAAWTLTPVNGSGASTTAGSGIWLRAGYVVTATAIAPSATITTITFANAVVAKAAVVTGYAGASATLRGTSGSGTGTGGSASATTSGTALVAGDLVIGFIGAENTTITGDTDTIFGTWSTMVSIATSGGSGATNALAGIQDKIVNATGSQTFNPIGGGADCAAQVISLQPAPPPAITLAAYGFYADGTESGAATLAAQDTAPSVDISSADQNMALRIRLQSTNASAIPSTSDFQLEWEKNASGTWNAVSAGAASYSSANASNNDYLQGSGDFFGEAFLGNGAALSKLSMWLRTSGSMAGVTVTAELYAHTGTFGVNGVGTGSPLATSTTRLGSALSGTTFQMEDFVFDGTFTLVNGTPYVIGVTATGPLAIAGPSIWIGMDDTSPTSPGTGVNRVSSAWAGLDYIDYIFSVTTVSAVLAYVSPNLTDAGVTTRRLTVGTGAFTAGEVSEDGLVDDLGWPGNNYTEVLYPITLMRAALANGDTIRFRVTKDGATTDMTYTAVPTLTVTAGPVPVTIGASLAVTATIGAAAVETGIAGASLAVTATIAAAAVRAAPVAAGLAVTATVTAAGGGVIAAPSAGLAATATITAGAVPTRGVGAALAVTATTTAGAVPTVAVAGTTLAVVATVTTGAIGVRPAAAGLAVTATIGADLTRLQPAGAALAVTASIAAGAVVVKATVSADAALAVVATISAGAGRGQPLDTTLAVTATITAGALQVVGVGASLAITATATAGAVRVAPADTGLAVTATISAGLARVQLSGASLAVTASITTGALPVAAVTAGLVVTATVSAGAAPTHVIAAGLAITATTTAGAAGVQFAGASLAVVATVTTGAIPTRTVGAALAVTATTTAGAARALFVGTNTLAVTASITAAPTGGQPVAANPLAVTATITAGALAGVRVTGNALAIVATVTTGAAVLRPTGATLAVTATATAGAVAGVRVAANLLAVTATISTGAARFVVAGAALAITATTVTGGSVMTPKLAGAALAVTTTITADATIFRLPTKIWVDDHWEIKPVFRWNGTQWVPAKIALPT